MKPCWCTECRYAHCRCKWLCFGSVPAHKARARERVHAHSTLPPSESKKIRKQQEGKFKTLQPLHLQHLANAKRGNMTGTHCPSDGLQLILIWQDAVHVEKRGKKKTKFEFDLKCIFNKLQIHICNNSGSAHRGQRVILYKDYKIPHIMYSAERGGVVHNMSKQSSKNISIVQKNTSSSEGISMRSWEELAGDFLARRHFYWGIGSYSWVLQDVECCPPLCWVWVHHVSLPSILNKGKEKRQER